MSGQTWEAHPANPETNWLYRVGGISAVVLAIAYIATMPLYGYAGATPSGGEAWLSYLNGKTTVWWAILGLSILTDFLFIPVILALYFALKEIRRNLLLLGLAFVGLFVVLDLAVTWPNYAALITLSSHYSAETSDAQRAAFIAAASYPDAVLGYSLSVYSIMVISFGIFLVGLVMRRGAFNKITAYLALATGTLGIAGTVGSFFIKALGASVIITSLLTILWLIFAGYRLYRLGQPSQG